VSEGKLATSGAVVEIIGFVALMGAIYAQSLTLLFIALAIVVCGFALMMPSLNSLISRRSDPAKQGGILGVSQSVSSLARILGPMVGIPLLAPHVLLPYLTASALMGVGLLLVLAAVRGGTDWPSSAQMAGPH
jgi:hypothetical protein